MDLDILRGNDWVRFRPKLICAEVTLACNSDTAGESVGDYLASVGYQKRAQTVDFGVTLNEIYVARPS
jgi:hypothetical protein